MVTNMRDTLNLMSTASRMPGRKDLQVLVTKYKSLYLRTAEAVHKNLNTQTIHDATNKVKRIRNIISTETGRKTSNCDEDSLNADNLNKCYVNIANELATNVTSSNGLKIQDITSPLKAKNTKDVFAISVKLIKTVAASITVPISDIINSCTSKGRFPDRLRSQKCCLHTKKGNRKDPGNYLPIAILPAFSKIFETALTRGITSFLNQHNLLHHAQFGFHQGMSTTNAIRSILTYITDALENGSHATAGFCDISKALDLVDHNALLERTTMVFVVPFKT